MGRLFAVENDDWLFGAQVLNVRVVERVSFVEFESCIWFSTISPGCCLFSLPFSLIEMRA